MALNELPRLSEKEFLIMSMLISSSSKPLYGLEMVEQSNGMLKRGTIYVTLSRLQEKGYVSSEREPEQPGVASPRRLYKVTGEGKKIYRALSNLGGANWLKGAMA